MEHFVRQESIVRRIWGSSDIILMIFAGAAAEFALNKAVDWLYFTGKLPADPLGRLFSTVRYARMIVFAPLNEAEQALDQLRQIHSSLEQKRGYAIPDWAYRDVLFMLIDYSIRSYELLESKLQEKEKHEVYDVFYRVGSRMGLKDLPKGYQEWLTARESHLVHDLENSAYTHDLFLQYRKHLGPIRYKLLREGQKLIVPHRVKDLLQLHSFSLLAPAIPLYKISRRLQINQLLTAPLFPPKYKDQIKGLDVVG